jgi:hypothetical protein
MLQRMTEYLKGKESDREVVPRGFYIDLETITRELERQFIEQGYISELNFMRQFRLKLHTDLTVGEAREIVSGIEHILTYGSTSQIVYRDDRLERKISALEHELFRLRLTPALEKKVAKIEEELRKLRVSSIGSLEDTEKEQKDMLKAYKEAEKRVFVIMPFAPIFDDVWNGGIKRACNSEDFSYMRVDKISLSSWITEDIVNYVEMADFIIADITGNNPNVMFELGWALAKNKKPIVIRQQNDPNIVPFDVKDIRYIPYVNSWSGIERLYRDICKFLKTTSETVNEETPKKTSRKKKSQKT